MCLCVSVYVLPKIPYYDVVDSTDIYIYIYITIFDVDKMQKYF